MRLLQGCTKVNKLFVLTTSLHMTTLWFYQLLLLNIATTPSRQASKQAFCQHLLRLHVMSVTEVLAELKHEHFQKSPSWGSGKVFVARDNQFIDVSSLSTGLSPDQQQAFVKKIDDILLWAGRPRKDFTPRVVRGANKHARKYASKFVKDGDHATRSLAKNH